MKLVIDELRSSALTQEITIKHHGRTRIKAIRLHLVGFNSPSGDLRLRVIKDSTSRASKTLPVSTIENEVDAALSTTDAHWHGFVKFEFDTPLILGEGDIVDLELTGQSGYSFSES